jgi:hypothetical protein
MRVFNFIVVAAVFATIFLAIATLSALATSAVHGQLSAKPKFEVSLTNAALSLQDTAQARSA